MQNIEVLIKERNISALKAYMAEHELVVRDGKIVPRDDSVKAKLLKLVSFWNQRQLARKILLNSLYGALLNPHMFLVDDRIGQSTTLSGRGIVKHMNGTINETITGKYDHEGEAIIYGDTDSVAGDSLIETNCGRTTIEELFNICRVKWSEGEKEYAYDHHLLVAGYENDRARQIPINYIYRHKVTKAKYKVIDSTGASVVVTEDHSLMVEREGKICEIKPTGLIVGDVLIRLSKISRSTVTSVERLDDFDNEYVYDIGVASDDPYFFANDILVHNSSYFSAYEYLKDKPAYRDFEWTREVIIEMYDLIAEDVNKTFPAFMQRTFNTSLERGSLIKAGRELVASKGLFIKKKKYAVLIYDLEGTRLDVDGKPGKLKAMGLDLKRADTPRIMQRFLESLLMDLLTDVPKETMYDNIRQFRSEFKVRPGWEKGAPKKVANLAEFASKHHKANTKGLLTAMKKNEKLRINTPGHVTASLNWNALCELYEDRHATRITDSARIIVCKLLHNIYDMSSIAFPIDETHLPSWFRELPFDHATMETKIIDNKLDNLVGVLDWDLTDTREKTGNEFFIF